MSDNLNLTKREKNELTGILYDEKKDRAKHNKDTRAIDNMIDKVLGRVTLHKKSEMTVSLFNGESYSKIAKGGTFQSEHGTFIVQDIIDEHRIKVNGNLHHKAEFEPASVLRFKRDIGMVR